MQLEGFEKRTGVSPGRGVLPILGMCDPKGYSFSAALVINRVSTLADFGKKGYNFVL